MHYLILHSIKILFYDFLFLLYFLLIYGTILKYIIYIIRYYLIQYILFNKAWYLLYTMIYIFIYIRSLDHKTHNMQNPWIDRYFGFSRQLQIQNLFPFLQRLASPSVYWYSFFNLFCRFLFFCSTSRHCAELSCP